MTACKDEHASVLQLQAICLSRGYCVPITETCQFLCLQSPICTWSAAFVLETEKKNPFLSSIVFAQSLTCVFFSLSGKSQDSPNTAQGAEKCFLEGEKQSPFDADFFPLKKP